MKKVELTEFNKCLDVEVGHIEFKVQVKTIWMIQNLFQNKQTTYTPQKLLKEVLA